MYESRITRQHRTAFVLLCDRSGSMAEDVVFGGTHTSKAEAVARTINSLIDELINRSRREGGVRDYFDIAVLGYSGHGVVPLIGDGAFATASELVRRPVETRKETVLRMLPSGNQVTAVVTHRQWISPGAEGDTPLGAALAEAHKMVRSWCARPANRESFPPIVINITDGAASDADEPALCAIAEKIRATGTADGNTLLFNIHLAPTCGTDEPVVKFPSDITQIPTRRYARLLFDMASDMPTCFDSAIGPCAASAAPPYRAVSFNCQMDELFAMLTIGSLSISLIA